MRIWDFSLNIHSWIHHNVSILEEDNISALLNFASLGFTTMFAHDMQRLNQYFLNKIMKIVHIISTFSNILKAI